MTPKEKAKELVSKINGIESEQPCFIISVSQNKKAAIIAVEEIYEIDLKPGRHEGEKCPENYYSFWEDVREEINKL